MTTSLRPIILVPGTGGTMIEANTEAQGNKYNPGDPWVWVDIVAPWGLDDDEVIHNMKLKHTSSTVANQMAPYYTDVKVGAKKTTDDLLPISNFLNGEQCYLYTMINDLKKLGYVPGKTLWGFAYDWRQDWKIHFGPLAQRIDQALKASGADKVYLVGHSQGTQLIETLLVDAGFTAYQSKVAGVINVGAPYVGAAVALRASAPALGGYDFGIDYYGLGMEMATGLEIGKNSPSVYQMSPTSKYESSLISSYGYKGSIVSKKFYYDIWGNLDKEVIVGPTGDPHAYTQSRQTDKQLTSWANTTHGQWDSQKYTAPLLNIAGKGIATEVGYLFSYNYLEGVYMYSDLDYRFQDGDGTVPAISCTSANSRSSRPSGSASILFTNGDHTSMVDPTLDEDNQVYYNVFPTISAWLTKIGAYAPSSQATATPAKKTVQMQGAEAEDEQSAPILYERDFLSLVATRVDRKYEVVVTDLETGRTEHIRITGKGKMTRRKSQRTDVLVKVAVVPFNDNEEQLTLNVQFGMKPEKQYDIELQATDGDVDVFRRLYRSGDKEITNRKMLKQTVLRKDAPLKFEFRRGGHRFLLGGQALE